MGLFLNTYGTSKVGLKDSEVARKVLEIFDMKPASIIKRLKLKEPIYTETAAYGHMGRKSEIKVLKFISNNNKVVEKQVETFTWEKLDYVDKIKEAFGL